METFEGVLKEILEHLVGRVHGAMHLRVLLQPLMAGAFACWDGYKDARAGRPAYFWGLFTGAADRRGMLKSGWKSVGKIFVVALALDAVYQFIELKWFYPLEAVVVAVLLALVPYLVLRGPAKRLFGLWVERAR